MWVFFDVFIDEKSDWLLDRITSVRLSQKVSDIDGHETSVRCSIDLPPHPVGVVILSVCNNRRCFLENWANHLE